MYWSAASKIGVTLVQCSLIVASGNQMINITDLPSDFAQPWQPSWCRASKSECVGGHFCLTPHTLIVTLRVRALLAGTLNPPTLFNTPHAEPPPTAHAGWPRGMQRRVWVKVRRSSPSVGMKLRGPGSSGNAEMAVRSSQTSRKKKGGVMVFTAAQRWTLWTFLERQGQKEVSVCQKKKGRWVNHADRETLSFN